MKAIKWMDRHIEEVLLVILTSAMVASIFFQIIMRLFGSSLGWSEEFARYCFIWLIYIGISYGVKKQRHLKVDVVLLFLKERGKLLLNIIVSFIFLLFALVFMFYGGKIAIQLLIWGQASPAMGIPMGLVYLATPVGLGLTTIRLIQRLIDQFKYLFGRDGVGKDAVEMSEQEKYANAGGDHS